MTQDQISAHGHGDRRTQILDAAQALLTEGGFAAATVRAVASRAGIGASTMRYWFPSQAALTTALAQRALTVELSDKRLNDATVPAAERLFECLAQFLPGDDSRVHEVEGWFALLVSAVGPTATPVGSAMYAGMLETTREHVIGWLDRLAAEGAIDGENISKAATALLCRIDGIALGLLHPGQIPDLATAHEILRADVQGLMRAAPTP